MGWRFYAQRAVSKQWLDTDVELNDMEMSWMLSGPCSGKANIPVGMNKVLAGDDGRPVFGKWDTILYGEEDSLLSWVGICYDATPDKDKLNLEFIGSTGWLQGVDYDKRYAVWQTDAFDVVRHLIATANATPGGLDIIPSNNDSGLFLGDAQPPPEPVKPIRKQGQTLQQYYDTKAYKDWKTAHDAWKEKYGEREFFEIAWWEAPYIGEEIDSLATEVGFDYRERYAWADRANLVPRMFLDLNVNMVNRRSDIAFVDGMNLAAPLEPAAKDIKFANNIIALGAGEGRAMVRARVGRQDGRLYQAQYTQHKTIKNQPRLRSLADADFRLHNDSAPQIGALRVWDIEGYTPLKTLMVGDEIQVVSQNYNPAINQWVRVIGITRNPKSAIVDLVVQAS